MNAQVRSLRLEGGRFAKRSVFFLPSPSKLPDCCHASRSVANCVDASKHLIQLATGKTLGGKFFDRPDNLNSTLAAHDPIIANDVFAPPANPPITATFNISTLI